MANSSANPQCPFCQLVANPEQTFDVHETEHFRAWLDINPRARGHTMIVPKEHLTSMEELGDNVDELFDMIHAVMKKARNGLDADGVSVVLNDGEAAGQNLEHFYAQVFPRFEGEENAGAPAGAVFQPMEDLEESDLEEISESMFNASHGGGGKSVDGPGTTLTRNKRTEGHASKQSEETVSDEDGQILDRDDLEDSGKQNSSDAEKDKADDEDDKEKKKKKRRSQWDGDNYSWGSDGAEFK